MKIFYFDPESIETLRCRYIARQPKPMIAQNRVVGSGAGAITTSGGSGTTGIVGGPSGVTVGGINGFGGTGGIGRFGGGPSTGGGKRSIGGKNPQLVFGIARKEIVPKLKTKQILFQLP